MKSMVVLKSKSGCVTCLTRKKKCDEAYSLQGGKCGQCERLGLTCVRRGSGTTGPLSKISATNLKPPIVPLPVSNGYPAFQSDIEKRICSEGPQALRHHISRMAGPEFQVIDVFGQFSTDSRLVREALVAFSAYGQPEGPARRPYELSLKSYNQCIRRLGSSRAYESSDPLARNITLIAILFLALLEGLKLGDPGNSVLHFQMCQRLLAAQLSSPSSLEDKELVKVYRITAECIIYNFATLSPFHPQIGHVATDWGDSFDCLFSGTNYLSSPFFGGFPEIYHVMFRTNVLLHHVQARALTLPATTTVLQEFESLWHELARLENKISLLYLGEDESPATTELYRAKYRIHVLALRIHLIKVCRDNVRPDDLSIKHYLRECMNILTRQDVLEPGNPALRWPFTILICAAHTDEDFNFLASLMKRTAEIIDPANSRKLVAAYQVVQKFRRNEPWKPKQIPSIDSFLPKTPIDLLLDPRVLDDYSEIGTT